MQVIITDGWFRQGQPFYLSGLRLALIGLIGSVLLAIPLAGLLYYGTLGRVGVELPGTHDERRTRESLEVLARQMGELSAKLVQVEALADRVSGLAGVNPVDLKAPRQGGPLVGLQPLEASMLSDTLSTLGQRAERQQDLMTVLESRLLDDRVRKLMLPTQSPVAGHESGSRFGWRLDPFSGQSALHTGLDFPADVGTPVVAAAGGLVVTQEFHPAYGNLVELDHGKDVLTRYAHLSKTHVAKGDLVKRGQRIAEVGNTGRSTGPHLHFEVLVEGAFQNPELFLKAGQKPVASAVAAAKPSR